MTHRALLIAVTFAIALVAAPAARAAQYAIDPQHSFVQFRTMHLGVSWLHGRFNKIEGTFSYDAGAGAGAQSVQATIDTSSIDTNHAERDKHLRSADFFDTDQFPTATFASTSFVGDASGGTLTGDLTLRGVTREITITVRPIGEGADPWGGYRAGFEGMFTLVRGDFGMTYDLGPAAETTEVHLIIEGIRQ